MIRIQFLLWWLTEHVVQRADGLPTSLKNKRGIPKNLPLNHGWLRWKKPQTLSILPILLRLRTVVDYGYSLFVFVSPLGAAAVSIGYFTVLDCVLGLSLIVANLRLLLQCIQSGLRLVGCRLCFLHLSLHLPLYLLGSNLCHSLLQIEWFKVFKLARRRVILKGKLGCGIVRNGNINGFRFRFRLGRSRSIRLVLATKGSGQPSKTGHGGSARGIESFLCVCM